MKEDRLLKTDNGTFALAGWDGVNASGIEPVCDKVLVRVDQALAKIGSMHIPEEISARQTMAATTGMLIAVGPVAFMFNSTRTAAWDGAKPQPGQRVAFTKFAGQEYTGLDGLIYRVMDDVVIGGIMGS